MIAPARIGDMKHRIEVQHEVGTQFDASGAEVEVWSKLGDRWAQVLPLSAKQLESARQVYTEVTHRITFRYLEGADEQCRIQFKDRTFEILEVMNLEERNVWMVCLAKEKR